MARGSLSTGLPCPLGPLGGWKKGRAVLPLLIGDVHYHFVLDAHEKV